MDSQGRRTQKLFFRRRNQAHSSGFWHMLTKIFFLDFPRRGTLALLRNAHVRPSGNYEEKAYGNIPLSGKGYQSQQQRIDSLRTSGK